MQIFDEKINMIHLTAGYLIAKFIHTIELLRMQQWIAKRTSIWLRHRIGSVPFTQLWIILHELTFATIHNSYASNSFLLWKCKKQNYRIVYHQQYILTCPQSTNMHPLRWMKTCVSHRTIALHLIARNSHGIYTWTRHPNKKKYD